MADRDRVPRLACPFVAVLIAAMIAAAAFVWEPWPLTSFRLFSHLRAEEQSAWLATAVDAGGEEHPSAFAGDERYRHFGFAMSEFVAATGARRDELCRAWLDGAVEANGADVRLVRIYLRRWLLSDRAEDRALPGERELRFVCSPDGATDVG